MKKTVKMEWVKSTKGTHVYSNDEADTPVTSIYVKRNGLPTDPPAQISLTIEYEVENVSA